MIRLVWVTLCQEDRMSVWATREQIICVVLCEVWMIVHFTAIPFDCAMCFYCNSLSIN